MRNDSEATQDEEFDEQEDVGDLAVLEIDEDDLDDDDLDEDDIDEDFEGENLNDEIEDDDNTKADDEDDKKRPPRAEEDDEEDDDEEKDKEADLEAILRDRLAAEEDLDDSDEKDPHAGSSGGEDVEPRRDDEFLCVGCFLLVTPGQFGAIGARRCPSGEEICPALEKLTAL